MAEGACRQRVTGVRPRYRAGPANPSGGDADEQAVGEVALELRAQDLVGGGLDVVLDALELERLLLGVVDGEAGAVVVVAGLAHRTDADDVLAVGGELEVDRRQLFHRGACQREHLAQVRMADEREVPELVVDGQALSRLLGREDVLELFETDRRAVAEVQRDLVELDLVGQAAQPLHVLRGQQGGVRVEGVAGRLVVVRIVHPAGDGGVVVAEDARLGALADQVGALVRRPSVADGVTQAVVVVDLLGLVRLEHCGERLVVRVDVAEDAETHWGEGER